MADYRLLTHLKDILPDQDNKLFPDRVYKAAMWAHTQETSTELSYTASRYGETNLFRYSAQMSKGHLLWDVRVTSTHAGADFEYDEAACTIADLSNVTTTDLTITGKMLDFRYLRYFVLMQVASDPAAAATYCQVNGLTIDMRGASRMIRESAQQLLGARGF
jgi:hypothetical protein